MKKNTIKSLTLRLKCSILCVGGEKKLSKDIRISYAGARKNAGFTQKEASKKLNIAEKTLISYENGRTIPRWDNHCKMAELYGIPKECLCPPSNSNFFDK